MKDLNFKAKQASRNRTRNDKPEFLVADFPCHREVLMVKRRKRRGSA